MATRKKKPGSGSDQEKTYTFTFSLPEAIGLCSGCVLALCAFFVLGILLGRGYQPENDVPELAMMMPHQSSNASGEVKGGILKPEELLYMDSLKIKPISGARPDEKVAAKKPKAKSKPTVNIVQKMAPAKQAAAKTAVTESVKSAVTTKDTEPEPLIEMDNPDEVGPPVYDYLYQAASFGTEQKAEEFKGKLLADGLDASVEPGKSGTKTWYRVFVRHLGSAESTQSMRAVLAKYGIKKPLLKSKKAVE
ncbi:SPOR domain-containing protein [Maridesulfovibrio frigidus]|uniref:SPOR domain-containing protein n=1 Tax=Maridesulfovibrio frigidus TaxID=340956 RepID=UPI0004E1AFF0|nr:SPOR domain-containing protein [Maridesulfovibrio frigidus]